jgi:DNA polymerase-3 subunit epsilon
MGTPPYDPRRPVRFDALLSATALVVIDTETTGVGSTDAACEIGIARFEGDKLVGSSSSRCNPGKPIPEGATAVHGITDADVADKPTPSEYMQQPNVQELLRGAQPAAYNAPFDRRMLPWQALEGVLAQDWPWLDVMVLLKSIDRFAKGAGRHKLTTACERHGIELVGAHGALADATATGQLFYKLAPVYFEKHKPVTVGKALELTQRAAAEQWADFESYWAKKAAAEGAAGT